jgi:hypothetical protein
VTSIGWGARFLQARMSPKLTVFTNNLWHTRYFFVTNPSELDLAQLKYEMRAMYGHIGYVGSLQVVYEMLIGAQVLMEVITEERQKGAQ